MVAKKSKKKTEKDDKIAGVETAVEKIEKSDSVQDDQIAVLTASGAEIEKSDNAQDDLIAALDIKIAALVARVRDLEKFAMATVPHDEKTMVAQRDLRKRIGDFK